MQKPIFLTGEWRKLAMANYIIDPKKLEHLVPYGTELDIWQGNCYVSLVGFMFYRTRLLGVPIPFHQQFEEVNLRFYVKRIEPDGELKRGVVFVKELVPLATLAIVANTMYGEHYYSVPMQHKIAHGEQGLHVAYSWQSGGEQYRFVVTAEAKPYELPRQTEAEFITEHYWGYTRLKEGLSSEYQVEHPSWQLYQTKEWEISGNWHKLYGEALGSALTNQEPHSVFLAEGSPITVRKRRMIG